MVVVKGLRNPGGQVFHSTLSLALLHGQNTKLLGDDLLLIRKGLRQLLLDYVSNIPM